MQVEILSDADWWQPWLPVLGSTIVAAAAIVGIIKSNKTNRDAITAADDREFAKWRRETILKLSSEAATAALDISRDVRELITRKNREVDDEIRLALDRIELAIRRLPEIEEHLRLVGAVELADKCGLIATSLSAAWGPAVQCIDARVAKPDAPTMAAARAAFDMTIGMVDSSRVAFVAEAQRQLGPTSA